MGSSTIGFVSMKNVPSTAKFMESVKDSINALIDESYKAHGVDLIEVNNIPLIRNQARINGFNYNVSGGYERFVVDFSLFIDKADFSTHNAYKRFKMNFGDPQAIAEGKDAIPNEGRMLYIIPECMDYKEAFDGPKMVLSLGSWGHSSEIITRILDDYGVDYYFAADDCADEYEKRQPTSKSA